MAETNQLNEHISALDAMKKYPSSLYYRGDLTLLDRLKISIVGSRRPSAYTQQMTYELAKKLSSAGVCIVSGAAMGVDAIAHNAAGANNTIAIMANGLDIRYPAVNRSLITAVENEGLVLSQFEDGKKAAQWSFVVRNELVVALGDVLIVTQADEKSGSMRSVEYALKMGKQVYVLLHRMGESEGTNSLLRSGKAKAIYNIDAFIEPYGLTAKNLDNPFLLFCQNRPTYEEAVQRYPQEVFQYELEGKIDIIAGCVVVI
ncbi:MAG: DNA-processing protein DprA [Epsilonproteobacteria bacterium]|nr:MAG: DNA-processing protein DprA [Campylobacterota bacterium]